MVSREVAHNGGRAPALKVREDGSVARRRRPRGRPATRGERAKRAGERERLPADLLSGSLGNVNVLVVVGYPDELLGRKAEGRSQLQSASVHAAKACRQFGKPWRSRFERLARCDSLHDEGSNKQGIDAGSINGCHLAHVCNDSGALGRSEFKRC